MNFPTKAIFAFNANIDHHCFPTETELKRIGDFAPTLLSQIEECFAYGMQREVPIDTKVCNFLLPEFKTARKLVGGQAGNAAGGAMRRLVVASAILATLLAVPLVSEAANPTISTPPTDSERATAALEYLLAAQRIDPALKSAFKSNPANRGLVVVNPQCFQVPRDFKVSTCLTDCVF